MRRFVNRSIRPLLLEASTLALHKVSTLLSFSPSIQYEDGVWIELLRVSVILAFHGVDEVACEAFARRKATWHQILSFCVLLPWLDVHRHELTCPDGLMMVCRSSCGAVSRSCSMIVHENGFIEIPRSFSHLYSACRFVS